jgi:hypothetical protein
MGIENGEFGVQLPVCKYGSGSLRAQLPSSTSRICKPSSMQAVTGQPSALYYSRVARLSVSIPL